MQCGFEWKSIGMISTLHPCRYENMGQDFYTSIRRLKIEGILNRCDLEFMHFKIYKSEFTKRTVRPHEF